VVALLAYPVHAGFLRVHLYCHVSSGPTACPAAFITVDPRTLIPVLKHVLRRRKQTSKAQSPPVARMAGQ